MPDDDPASWWDEAYEEGETPWDVRRPQPALVSVAEAGAVEGRVLDVGCGTGTHALYVSDRGHPTTGVDVSANAVERAREKARDRGSDAEFRVGDARSLDADLGPFDAAIDSGLFHALAPGDRRPYADSLARVIDPGGRLFALAFGEEAPEDWGPTPVAPAAFREAFADGWRVAAVRETTFETRARPVPGLLAVVERL